LPEGAEDKPVVTGPEVQTNKKLSTEEKALLDQAEKDAKDFIELLGDDYYHIKNETNKVATFLNR